MTRQGDSYVISGRKWFSSGAASERCKFSIVMGVTNPDADPYRPPVDGHRAHGRTGVSIVREPTVFGYQDRGGHPRDRFRRCARSRLTNLLGEEGGGFAIAQAGSAPAGSITACARSGLQNVVST
jgi:acyl-CoA dehydrogenase